MAEAIYDIPSAPAYDPRIRRLQNSDPANAETVFNPLVQALVNNLHALKQTTDRFDCGFFDEAEEVLLHDSTPAAHRAMGVDGNAAEAAAPAESLELHMADPSAHQNLHLDGNQ